MKQFDAPAPTREAAAVSAASSGSDPEGIVGGGDFAIIDVSAAHMGPAAPASSSSASDGAVACGDFANVDGAAAPMGPVRFKEDGSVDPACDADPGAHPTDSIKPEQDRTATAGRLLLGAAAGMALYLAATALARTPLPGCGAASACQEALQSRYAYTFGVPVSFLGFAVYAMTVMQSWAFVRRERTFAGLRGGMASFVVLAGAVWFIVVQIFALKAICQWCCLTHACAVTGSALLWRSRLRHPLQDLDCSTDLRDAGSPLSNDRVFRFTATGAALAGVGMLALGSLSGPLQPRPAAQEVAAAKAVAPSSSATVALLDGRFQIRAEDYPDIGSRSPHARIAVLLSDFTSEGCRDYHSQLENMAVSASPPLRIIVLPAAQSPEAAEIQRTMLTLFHHNPLTWRSLAALITAGVVPAEPAAVARAALKLTGDEKFAAAARGVKIQAQLQLATEVIKESSREPTSTAVPRLYSGSRVLIGAESDSAKVLAFLETPASPPASAPAPQDPKPLLTVINGDVDLATLPAGQPHDFQIKVRNTGDAPLKLGWLTLDQGCEITQMPNGDVHPGQVAEIGVRFHVPAEEGDFTRRLQLHSDAPGDPAAIALHGRSSAPVAATPRSP